MFVWDPKISYIYSRFLTYPLPNYPFEMLYHKHSYYQVIKVPDFLLSRKLFTRIASICSPFLVPVLVRNNWHMWLCSSPFFNLESIYLITVIKIFRTEGKMFIIIIVLLMREMLAIVLWFFFLSYSGYILLLLFYYLKKNWNKIWTLSSTYFSFDLLIL